MAVAGVLFALGFVDNLKEVALIEQQKSKHHLIGSDYVNEIGDLHERR